MRLAIAFISAAVSGCATPYQPNGFTGGFTETQIAENVWRVTFEGNGHTGSKKAEDFALLRAADLTLKTGYTHFGLASSTAKENMAAVVTPQTSTTNMNAYRTGNAISGTATTNTFGGNMMFVSFPTANNTVVMFKGKPQGRDMVFDARFICNSIARKYEVACEVDQPSVKK
jgi:hypothetical protein